MRTWPIDDESAGLMCNINICQVILTSGKIQAYTQKIFSFRKQDAGSHAIFLFPSFSIYGKVPKVCPGDNQFLPMRGATVSRVSIILNNRQDF
jgi:hypothetical protein